jgi:DNA-directed RNA polymerase subunit K/omega
MIPVIIGKRTLNLLREQNVLDGKNRVKITRKEIKEIMRNVILSLPFRKMSISLLE